MQKLTLKRLEPDQVRIETDGTIKNDLSVTVGAQPELTYAPETNLNAQTSMRFTDRVPEGSYVYVAAFKGFGANYRPTPWSAAVSVGGEVIIRGGGFGDSDVATADGNYPLGNFIMPAMFDVQSDGLEPGKLYRLVYRFKSGDIEEKPHFADDEELRTRFMHERHDQLHDAWLAVIGEQLNFPPADNLNEEAA